MRMETRLIEVPRRLDSTNADGFEQLCRRIIGQDAVNLDFDFGQVIYVSSAGLRSVLSIGKDLQARGGTLQLLNLGGMVRQIFDLSGFLSLFPHQP